MRNALRGIPLNEVVEYFLPRDGGEIVVGEPVRQHSPAGGEVRVGLWGTTHTAPANEDPARARGVVLAAAELVTAANAAVRDVRPRQNGATRTYSAPFLWRGHQCEATGHQHYSPRDGWCGWALRITIEGRTPEKHFGIESFVA